LFPIDTIAGLLHSSQGVSAATVVFFDKFHPTLFKNLPERTTTMTKKYTEDHEWLDIAGDTATVGITHHAQDALGDVVFVDLPEVGKDYAQKDTAGVVESVKAAADVYMPVSGTVTEVNEALRADPSLANSDPLGAGWFFKVKLSNPSQIAALMDETSYSAFEKTA
jgi:glycine cleavage system H protein